MRQKESEESGGESEGFRGKRTVIFGSPGSAVDVDVVGIQAESTGLDSVVDSAVQHPNTCVNK